LETFTNKTITSSTNVIGGVTMTLGSDANWDLYTRNASGVLERIANGTTGQFLGANTGAKPTWQSPSGGGGAPTDAQYLVLALNGTLSAERLLTAGVNTKFTDGGANGNLTVDVGSEDFRLPGDISPAQLTADQNDWAPTGHGTSSTIRFSTDAARNITGMAGGADGVIRILHNIGSFNATIVNESTSSTAANRFAFGNNLTIGAGQSITVRYDATSSRWRGEDNNGAVVEITSGVTNDLFKLSSTGTIENFSINELTADTINLSDEIMFRDTDIKKTSIDDLLRKYVKEYLSKNAYEYFNDFITTVSTTTVGSEVAATNSGTGAATSAQATDNATNVGLNRTTTGTTATGRSYVNSSASSIRFGGGEWFYQIRNNITTLSTSTERFQELYGFFDTYTAANQTDGAYFLYDEGGVSTGSAASPNWQLVTASNGSRTFTTTSTAVTAGSYTKLRIEVNAAGTSVTFYINGNPVGTHTTNIPVGSGRELGFGWGKIKSVGTTARTTDIDHLIVQQKYTTPK
jgi:hypothetical protein